MLRLGGQTMGTDNAREFSSAAKGETLEDTIRIVSGYADVIVVRHNEEGAAKRSASVSSGPIINAGDGPGQHPTQARLDLYTIKGEPNHVDCIKVARVADLANGRTVRSLTYLLSKFKDIQMTFVAPPMVAMRDDLKAHLDEHHVPWVETADLDSVLPEVDVVYMTRIQKERFSDPAAYEAVKGVYRIDKRSLELMRKYAIVMHPLPPWTRSRRRSTPTPGPRTFGRHATDCTCAWRSSTDCWRERHPGAGRARAGRIKTESNRDGCRRDPPFALSHRARDRGAESRYRRRPADRRRQQGRRPRASPLRDPDRARAMRRPGGQAGRGRAPRRPPPA